MAKVACVVPEICSWTATQTQTDRRAHHHPLYSCVWLQVFKFDSAAEREPSLALGKKFEPARSNDDTERFCQPTDVAVASNDDFYVADG